MIGYSLVRALSGQPSLADPDEEPWDVVDKNEDQEREEKEIHAGFGCAVKTVN